MENQLPEDLLKLHHKALRIHQYKIFAFAAVYLSLLSAVFIWSIQP